MSAHHWLRLPVTRERPSPQSPRIHEMNMNWLAQAETEVFCPP